MITATHNATLTAMNIRKANQFAVAQLKAPAPIALPFQVRAFRRGGIRWLKIGRLNFSFSISRRG